MVSELTHPFNNAIVLNVGLELLLIDRYHALLFDEAFKIKTSCSKGKYNAQIGSYCKIEANAIFDPMKKAFYDKEFKVGVLGGGQLGRMLIQDAINLNIDICCLDPAEDAPCSALAAEFTQGDLNDYNAVYNFGKDKDLVTIEIEHVNVDALEALEQSGIPVYPQPHLLRLIQDKGLQKQFYAEHKIPTARFELVKNASQIDQTSLDLPLIQKMRKGGYDGKGVVKLTEENKAQAAFDAPSVLEELIDFDTEVAVIVARTPSGSIRSFPPVALSFHPTANLVEFLYAPGKLSPEIVKKAQNLAIEVAVQLGIVGLLAVELFVTKSGEVLVNEIAPRPHNSGHQSIEANVISQYEQHLRAILDLPLGDTELIHPSVMVNLLGADGHSGPAQYNGLEEVLSWPGVHVHLYGKTETRPFRKMGHATVVHKQLDEAIALAERVKTTLRITSK